ncbi:MAG: hypothetical protein BIFFINMI_02431 [Phycisphaerae bacterium]|nr:hypothetical protein [Phycisphaerae bacterium]
MSGPLRRSFGMTPWAVLALTALVVLTGSDDQPRQAAADGSGWSGRVVPGGEPMLDADWFNMVALSDTQY